MWIELIGSNSHVIAALACLLSDALAVYVAYDLTNRGIVNDY